MEPDPVALRQVDVTAHEIDKNISDILKQAIFGPSKIRESYMTAGASVDAVSIKDIKMSPALNFYEGLDDIKEVETKQLSAIYTALIVRGTGVKSKTCTTLCPLQMLLLNFSLHLLLLCR